MKQPSKLTNGTETIDVQPYKYDFDYVISKDGERYFEKVGKTRYQEVNDYSGTLWGDAS